MPARLSLGYATASGKPCFAPCSYTLTITVPGKYSVLCTRPGLINIVLSKITPYHKNNVISIGTLVTNAMDTCGKFLFFGSECLTKDIVIRQVATILAMASYIATW